MSSIVNNFAENSVMMNAGSTMNGDVHIENVNQGKDEGSTTENTNDSEQKQQKSPLRLSRKKGHKDRLHQGDECLVRMWQGGGYERQ